MLQHLALFLALVAPPPQVIQTAEGQNLHSPQDNSLYFFGGSRISIGNRFGCGWKFADGSVVEVASTDATYHWSIWETECYRIFLCVGPDFRVSQEWYLGKGVATTLDLGARSSTFGIVWYPVEGTSFSFVLDPWRGCVGWGWTLTP